MAIFGLLSTDIILDQWGVATDGTIAKLYASQALANAGGTPLTFVRTGPGGRFEYSNDALASVWARTLAGTVSEFRAPGAAADDAAESSTYARKNQFNILDYGGLGSADNRIAFDATIAAVVESSAGKGVIELPPGDYVINTPDTYGNGLTLPDGVHLHAAFPGTVRIQITTTVTWAVLARHALTQVSGIEVDIIAGGTATYGVGVDTPGAVGSAHSCVFTDVLVQSYSGGVLTNAFAVGPTHTGVSTVDIAETNFTRCYGVSYVNAGWLLGNGTAGNILNTRMAHCSAAIGAIGIDFRATNFVWTDGDFSYNTTCDIHQATATGECKVDGFRSENSAALWVTTSAAANVGGACMANGSWHGANLASPGFVIDYNQGGIARVSNLVIAGTAIQPMFRLSDGADTVLIIDGLASEAPLEELISSGYATPSKSSAIVTGYIQMTAGGIDPPVAHLPGPVRLGPQTDHLNSLGYRTLRATETLTLAGGGAVTLPGVCETAAVTLSANATSSTITNGYFGQIYTLEWVQDGTGSRTYVWPTACRFAANTAPTPTTTANRSDSVTFRYDGTLWRELSRAINVPVT